MKKIASAEARFVEASDQSLIVYFGEKTSPEAHESVRGLAHLLDAEPIPGLRNVHPGYASVLVKFDGVAFTHSQIEKILKEYFARTDKVNLPPPRQVEIPVCYNAEFGPDLEGVAMAHNLAKERVIELHSALAYHVYCLGFVPGFAYLGDLPVELVTPRLPTPRRTVPAGSVGIAGNQTGVYPFATPGGWRLLGRTPLKMFQADRPELSLLAIGDHVKFVPVSREKFAQLERG
jgi:inhibitor of KinA